MIYIWDNARDYSDHVIAFVDSDAAPCDVRLVLCSLDGYDRRSFVVGEAASVAWRQDGATMTLAEWYCANAHNVHHDDECPAWMCCGPLAACTCDARQVVDALARLGLERAP